MIQLSHPYDYWKNHSFDYMDLSQQSDVFVFNMLSRFVLAFLPRSKCILISWLQSPFSVILALGLADISFPSVEQREVLEPVCGACGHRLRGLRLPVLEESRRRQVVLVYSRKA